MTAIDLARQFTDALIENDLAEEVPAFKKTFKDSNDNELRQVVDLGDGKFRSNSKLLKPLLAMFH